MYMHRVLQTTYTVTILPCHTDLTFLFTDTVAERIYILYVIILCMLLSLSMLLLHC